MTKEEKSQRDRLLKAYEFILDYADDSWRDPIWNYFYYEIDFETFTECCSNFNLDSEEEMIKFFKTWSNRRYKLKSFS